MTIFFCLNNLYDDFFLRIRRNNPCRHRILTWKDYKESYAGIDSKKSRWKVIT